MKKFVIVAMLGILPVMTFAQKNAPASTSTVQDVTEQNKKLQDQLNMQAIELATQTYGSAAAQMQIQVEKQLAPLGQAVTDAVIKARGFRGLGPEYNYNPQTKSFEKAPDPAPVKPGPPASVPPTTQEKPAEQPKK